MDPQACLLAILDAFATRDWTEYLDRCEDLMTWLRKGGAKPLMPAEPFGVTMRPGQPPVTGAQYDAYRFEWSKAKLVWTFSGPDDSFVLDEEKEVRS